MAGDWIPMRNNLAADPAVILVASTLGVSEVMVVGLLHKLWGWANEHLTDGYARGVTLDWIDRHVGATGFAAALLDAGWLHTRSGGVELPNFSRWNSQSGKQRVLTAARMRRHRDGASVTESSPEKRREEKSKDPPNPPPSGGSETDRKSRKGKQRPPPETCPLFTEFWEAYPRKVKRPAAARAFAKHKPTHEILTAILAGLVRWKASKDWAKDDGEFIPHPATWLNNRQWEDNPEPGEAPPEVPRVKTAADNPGYQRMMNDAPIPYEFKKKS